jgi:cytochrome c5
MITRLLALTLVMLAAGMATVLNQLEGIAAEAATAQMHMRGAGMGGHMMGGRLPPGFDSEDLPEPDSTGAGLLSRYCTQCHNLPSPGLHTPEEWPAVATRMFERMDGMSSRGHRLGMMRRHRMSIQAPTSVERETILAYLTEHALRPAAPRGPESPETPAMTLFRQTCSRCHALPDSASHAAEEWPLVVERMRKNMAALSRSGITDDERDTIVRYLQEQVGK